MDRSHILEVTDITTATSGSDDMEKKKTGPNVEEEDKVEEQLIDEPEKKENVVVEGANETDLTTDISGSDVMTVPNVKEDKVDEQTETVSKLRLEPDTDVTLEIINRSNKPYVSKRSNSETDTILGEAKIDDMSSQLQALAVTEDEVVDETGLVDNHIELVMEYANVSKNIAILALRAYGNVNSAIMALTDPQV